jgi:hypothetical protein
MTREEELTRARQGKEYYAVLAFFGDFWCPIVTQWHIEGFHPNWLALRKL